MASSVRELAKAFKSSGGEGSPVFWTAAIKIIEVDDDLSENEQLQIFKVICKDISVADLILAMKNKEKHTHYIQSEVSDL